jgi:hypothetical protein
MQSREEALAREIKKQDAALAGLSMYDPHTRVELKGMEADSPGVMTIEAYRSVLGLIQREAQRYYEASHAKGYLDLAQLAQEALDA